MSRVKVNIIANLLGRGIAGVLALVCVPFYLRYLGNEAYGLIGFFSTLQGLLSLLDMGLSATVNREMARLSAGSENARDMRNLLRTLEIIYWLIALVCGIGLMLLAPVIASRWVNVEQLPMETVSQAIFLMGLLFALQWPFNLYVGGLAGLQLQVLQNGITAGFGIVRNLGVLPILIWVSPTLKAFFLWQAGVSAVQSIVAGLLLWRYLPTAEGKTHFSMNTLRGVWRFAGGMTGITLTSLVLTQADKIILSKVLTLEQFGYYTLAGVAVSALSIPVSPIFNAVFPSLSQAFAAKDFLRMANLYHSASQLLAVLTLPAALMCIAFSRELLLLWTQRVNTADQVWLLVSILAIGSTLNALMNMPYALQLASGWTSLSLYINIGSAIVLIPSLLILIPKWGLAGAAAAWVLVNVASFSINVPLMHRRLLRGEKLRWYLEDIGLPALAAIVPILFARMMLKDNAGAVQQVGVILASGAVSLACAGLATTRIRAYVFQHLKPVRSSTAD